MFDKWLNAAWIERQPILFTVLRIAIGWHFLWEGCIKFANPTWSAKGYLEGSWGPLAPIFHGMANLTIQDTPILCWFAGATTAKLPWILSIVDISIPWLLLIAGLGLMLGFCSRLSIGLAMSLLAFFVVATPAYEFIIPDAAADWKLFSLSLEHAQWSGKPAFFCEGSYFLISKNVVELIALAALLTLDLRRLYGVDSLFQEKPEPSGGAEVATLQTQGS